MRSIYSHGYHSIATWVDQLEQILLHLNSGSGDSARHALGKALHTIQDFYSHSNWVELGNRLPHPGLGRVGNWIDFAGVSERTCTGCRGPLLDPVGIATCTANCRLLDESISDMCVTDCHCNNCTTNLVTDSLTSGYYHGEDAVPPSNVNKCWHGGDLDSSGNVRDGINKDAYDCAWSSHGPDFHWIAQDVAQKASEQFIDDIRATIIDSHGPVVADQQMRLLFGVGSVLAFVLDTTSSMRDIIGPLSAQLIQIVNERVNANSQRSSFVFAPFNDSESITPTVTSNPIEFNRLLSSLTASGGGECLGPSMRDLRKALRHIDAGSSIFLITDGLARDVDLLDSVITTANKKRIQIFTLLFESNCSDDGTYDTLASATGGQFHSLARDEVSQVARQIDFWLHFDLTPTFSAKTSSSSSLNRRSETRYSIQSAERRQPSNLWYVGSARCLWFPPMGVSSTLIPASMLLISPQARLLRSILLNLDYGQQS